jgi:hypothetical protein
MKAPATVFDYLACESKGWISMMLRGYDAYSGDRRDLFSICKRTLRPSIELRVSGCRLQSPFSDDLTFPTEPSADPNPRPPPRHRSSDCRVESPPHIEQRPWVCLADLLKFPAKAHLPCNMTSPGVAKTPVLSVRPLPSWAHQSFPDNGSHMPIHSSSTVCSALYTAI